MPTAAKAETIEQIASDLARANMVVLTDYRGLSVSALQGLRANLRPLNAEFRIAKNTLTRIAADQVGIEGLSPVLEGPLALGLAYGDMVSVAKALSDFARTSRVLVIRGGVVDGRYVSAADIEALSTLPAKEVLQARLLGLFKSPMQRTVTVLNGPSQSLAYVLQARADQLQSSAAD